MGTHHAILGLSLPTLIKIGSYDHHFYCVRISDMTSLLRHNCGASVLCTALLHSGYARIGCRY